LADFEIRDLRASVEGKEILKGVTLGINKGEVKTAVAACSEQTSIIDEFPPHEWHGVGAWLNWANDYDADARKNGITDGVVTLRSPRHIDIKGDRAYVVVPVNYTFKKKGR